MGAGVHAVRVRLRPAAVPRGLGAGRARADTHAAGALARRAERVAAAGAPVAPTARQGPVGQDHVTGRQATRLGDQGRRRTAARRTGQLSAAGRGQRGRDDERRQVHTQTQHSHTDQGHAEKSLIPREYAFYCQLR